MARIAFSAFELSEQRPRGIVRAVRALAENIARSPDHDSYCIISEVADDRRLRFHARPLAEWLAENPIKPPSSEWSFFTERWVIPFTPPIFAPAAVRSIHRVREVSWHFKSGRKSGLTAPYNDCCTSSESSVVAFDGFDHVFLMVYANPLLRLHLSPKYPITSMIFDCMPMRFDEGPGWNPQGFAGCTRRQVEVSRRLACISEHTQRDLHDLFGEEAYRKSFVLPLGHDVERFSRPRIREDVRKQLAKSGIPTNLPYVVVLGAIEDKKNIANILRACAIAAQHSDAPPFGVVLAGDERAVRRYASHVREARRALPVAVPGYLPDETVAGVIQQAHTLVFASLNEGFGLPILESMSAGTLVITSNICSMPEVGGEHALYCNPYDPHDIAARIVESLNIETCEYERRVVAAKAYAANFTWQAAAERLLEQSGTSTFADGNNLTELMTSGVGQELDRVSDSRPSIA